MLVYQGEGLVRSDWGNASNVQLMEKGNKNTRQHYATFKLWRTGPKVPRSYTKAEITPWLVTLSSLNIHSVCFLICFFLLKLLYQKSLYHGSIIIYYN